MEKEENSLNVLEKKIQDLSIKKMAITVSDNVVVEITTEKGTAFAIGIPTIEGSLRYAVAAAMENLEIHTLDAENIADHGIVSGVGKVFPQ